MPFREDRSQDEEKLPHVPSDESPAAHAGVSGKAAHQTVPGAPLTRPAEADAQGPRAEADALRSGVEMPAECSGSPAASADSARGDDSAPQEEVLPSPSDVPATATAGPFGIPLGRIRASLGRDLLKSLWQRHSVSRVAALAVIVYAVCTLSTFFFIVKPARARLHEIREEKSILHDYAVIQEAGAVVGHFMDGLMTGDQRLTVMSEVRLMAEGSGVSIIGDPELLMPRKLSKAITEYPVRLRLRGTYHEIGEFMALLESSPRFMQVEEVEILSDVASRSRDSDATLLLSLASWEG